MWQGLIGGTEALSVTSPNSLLQRITPNRGTHKHMHIHTLFLSAPGTYKTLRGIIHEAQLEALLVLKGLCQGVTQVVGGQGSFSTVLELGKNTLKRKKRTRFMPQHWVTTVMATR